MTNHKQPTWFYTICLSVLTLGASLTLGLLSFSGLFAIWPVVSFAAIAFGLSVAYEGEIYYQNIKGALDKLFKPDYLEEQIALNYLLNYFPKTTNEHQNMPGFFIKYVLSLNHLHAYSELSLSTEQQQRRQHVVTKMDYFENIFYQLLKGNARVLESITDGKYLTPEEKRELNFYIQNCPINSNDEPLKTANLKQHFQDKLRDNRRVLPFIKVFSAVVGISMTLATAFLLSEALVILPPLAALIPASATLFVITPMAMLAGTAHGLLTYNTVTNLVINNTLQQRFNKLRLNIKNHGLPLIITSVALFTLAIALAVCTAGTWWTILQQDVIHETTFATVIKLLIASVTGLSSLAFNLENTSATIDMINDSLRNPTNPFTSLFHYLKERTRKVLCSENVLQLINPFRLVLVITVQPLRVVFFLGHLISIGVSADRVPGISKNLSALLGIVSEFFEDWHYFFSIHSHDTIVLLNERLGAGHHHGLDLPSRLVILLVSPIYFLANLWHIGFSQFNQSQYQIESTVLVEKPLSLFSNFVDSPAAHIPYVQMIKLRHKKRITAEATTQENNKQLTELDAQPPSFRLATGVTQTRREPPHASTLPREQSTVSNEHDAENLSELSGHADIDDMSSNCSCSDHEFYFPPRRTSRTSTKISNLTDSTTSIIKATEVRETLLMFCRPTKQKRLKNKRIKTDSMTTSDYSLSNETSDISSLSSSSQRNDNGFFNPAQLRARDVDERPQKIALLATS